MPTETEPLTGKIWFLNVAGQELYFCRIGDTRAMCRCNSDGIHVYYTNFEGHTEEGVGYGNTMYRVDLHGGGNEKLFEGIVEGMCIQNGRLHYMNPDLEKNMVELY